MKRRIGLAALALLALAGLAVWGVARSEWLLAKARARIVEEVERATGGRASVERLEIDVWGLRARVDGFTLRGREAAGRAPFVQIDRLEVGAEVLSWWRRQARLGLVKVIKPRVRVYVNADGTTNLPEPRVRGGGANAMEELIRLRIGRLEIADGLFEYDSREVDFAITAEGLDAGLSYDGKGPRYVARVEAKRVKLPARVEPSLKAEAWLEANRLEVKRAEARLGDSSVEFSGVMSDWKRPKVALEYKGSARLAEIEASPVRDGFVVSSGRVSYQAGQGYRVEGELRGEQLGYDARGVRIRGVAVSSKFLLTPEVLTAERVSVRSPYGRWVGAGRLEQWRRFELNGELQAVALDRLQAILLDRPYPWNGALAGPLRIAGELAKEGLKGGEAEATLTVSPQEGELPVSGEVSARWRQSCACVDFGKSRLETPAARLLFSGVFGERLEVELEARGARDLEAALGLALREDGYKLPLRLDGAVRVSASIAGPLSEPRASGHAELERAEYEGVRVEQASGDFDVSSRELNLKRLAVRQDGALWRGDARVALQDWKAGGESELAAQLRVERADMGKLAGLAGTVEGESALQGKLGAPWGTARIGWDGGVVGKESLKRVTAELGLGADGALKGWVQHEKTRADFTGRWTHPLGEFRDGLVRGKAVVRDFQLGDWESLQPDQTRVEAVFGGELEGELALKAGEPELRSLTAAVSAPRLKAGSRELGAARLSGETKAGVLGLRASLALPTGTAEGEARITLKGDMAVEGALRLPRVTFGLINGIRGSAEPWPVRGYAQGGVAFRGSLKGPAGVRARATVSQLQVRPRQQELVEAQTDAGELVLRNAGDLVAEFDKSGLKVVSAKFTALETDLVVTGGYGFGAKAPWNLDVRGTANLAVLGSFYKDLVAGGAAQVSASVRGTPADPQLSGRMNITNASLFLKDLPNGIERAAGTVFFDKNRANIEKLTGATGGGEFGVNGFIGFAGGEVTYRLQGRVNNVRVRYPEGVSTTLDADLSLTGAPARSVLAGTITVERSGFMMGGDLASMVGNTGNPIPAAATQNEFLRNLQFDVRVRTSPDAVFLSNYTSDLQTEADLRLRGSPGKPILLGSIKANQGQVNFFGNRYTISRGEVLFYNTAVVQPQIDLDLETRVRGITVFLNVSGPLSRLNVNYRSEPPLQSSEILALLTVGRAPASTTGSVATSDRIRSQTVMENSAASNSLLGGALSAGLNSRTERFFGASRIRIDPNATGVDNLPQARLSIEQSLSRDIRLTYITNLNRSQQQVVQMEWDLSKQWSVIAIKDENGAFAVDFLLRRRF